MAAFQFFILDSVPQGRVRAGRQRPSFQFFILDSRLQKCGTTWQELKKLSILYIGFAGRAREEDRGALDFQFFILDSKIWGRCVGEWWSFVFQFFILDSELDR